MFHADEEVIWYLVEEKFSGNNDRSKNNMESSLLE